MFKKFLKIAKILLFNLILLTSTVSETLAQTAKEKETGKALQELFSGLNKTSEMKNLPQGDLMSSWVPGIIKTTLTLGGVSAFCVAIYAGILILTSRGKEETANKGKDILLYAVVGIIIISISLALISGISSLKFN